MLTDADRLPRSALKCCLAAPHPLPTPFSLVCSGSRMASDDAAVVVGSSATASAQVPLAVAAAQGVLTGPGSARQGVNFWTDRRGQALHRGRNHGGASEATDEPMPDAPLPPSSSSSMNDGLASSTTPAAPAWRRRRHRRFNAARQGTDGLFACTTPGCTRRYKYGQHRHCCGWCSTGAHTNRCDHAWQKVQMKQWRGSISVCATEGCGRTMTQQQAKAIFTVARSALGAEGDSMRLTARNDKRWCCDGCEPVASPTV